VRDLSARDNAAGFLTLLLVGQLLWGGFYIWRTSFPVDGDRVFSLWDDAMISMTYARNLAEGNGLVWNAGGERVQGFTNLGPTLVMAALHVLPLAPEHMPLAVQAVTLLLWMALLLLAWRVAGDLFPEVEGAPALAALSVASSASVGIWTLQGSDVGFVAVWLMAGLAILARCKEPDGRWPRALGLVAGLGPLIRPDLALHAAVWLSSAWLFPADRRRGLVAGIAVLASVLLTYLVFGQLYYGDPLPNTWYLKTTGVPRSELLAEGLRQVGTLLPLLLPTLGLAALAIGLSPRRRVLWVSAAQIGTALLWSVWVGGDWTISRGSRFVAPVLPVLLVLAAGGAALAADRWLVRSSPWLRLLLPALVLVPCAVLSSPKAARVEFFSSSEPTMYRPELQLNAKLAAYLREYSEPDTRVGVTWAGMLVYLSRRPGMDMLGKSDRHIARMAAPKHLPGHSKWDWAYVVGTARPDLIRAATRGLGRRADFRADYLSVRARDGLTFFVRRDAVAKLHDPAARLFEFRDGEWRPLAQARRNSR
jgi:hypothetical protein